MYSRGQFAVMGKVGRKALRLYHEEGLLVPAYRNEENGYHYYAEKQLAVLERIKRLRGIGLSLFEIRQVLDGKASEEELVKSRIRELGEQVRAVKELAAIADSPADKSPGTKGSKPGECMPDIRGFERNACLYVDENVGREDLGMSVGRLYEKAAREGRAVTGSHFVIYTGLADEEAFSMRTCLPVSGPDGEGVIGIREEKCLHLVFRGGFSKTGEAHVLIRKYAEEHDIALADTVIEVYNRDMSVDVYYPLPG